MITTVSQLSLHLRDARWRPVADIEGVKWALDVSSEEVEVLIDNLYLFAFNIAVNGSRRRELRFLHRSIEFYRSALTATRFQLPWPQIFRLIIPHDKPVIAGTEVDVGLNCDPDHRQHLIEAGQLQIVPMPNGKTCRPGPGGSPAVTRASFETFLQKAHARSFT